MIKVLFAGKGYDKKHYGLDASTLQEIQFKKIETDSFKIFSDCMFDEEVEIEKVLVLDIDAIDKDLLDVYEYCNIKSINSLMVSKQLLNKILKYHIIANIMKNAKTVNPRDEPYLANYRSYLISSPNKLKLLSEVTKGTLTSEPCLKDVRFNITRLSRDLIRNDESVILFENITSLLNRKTNAVRIIGDYVSGEEEISLLLVNVINYIRDHVRLNIFEMEYIITENNSLIITDIFPSIRIAELSFDELRILTDYLLNSRESEWRF